MCPDVEPRHRLTRARWGDDVKLALARLQLPADDPRSQRLRVTQDAVEPDMAEVVGHGQRSASGKKTSPAPHAQHFRCHWLSPQRKPLRRYDLQCIVAWTTYRVVKIPERIEPSAHLKPAHRGWPLTQTALTSVVSQTERRLHTPRQSVRDHRRSDRVRRRELR